MLYIGLSPEASCYVKTLLHFYRVLGSDCVREGMR